MIRLEKYWSGCLVECKISSLNKNLVLYAIRKSWLETRNKKLYEILQKNQYNCSKTRKMPFVFGDAFSKNAMKTLRHCKKSNELRI